MRIYFKKMKKIKINTKQIQKEVKQYLKMLRKAHESVKNSKIKFN